MFGSLENEITSNFEKMERKWSNFSEVDQKSLIAEYDRFKPSYDAFRTFFGAGLTEDNLMLGLNAIYGWMPTMLELKECKIVDSSNRIGWLVKKLNEAKMEPQNSLTEKDDYKCMATMINNSFVGLSKVLHFMNPQYFAIWDSRVASALGIKTPLHDHYGKFSAYQNFMRKSIDNKEIMDKVNVLLPTNCTPIRKLEFMLFYCGKKNNQIEA